MSKFTYRFNQATLTFEKVENKISKVLIKKILPQFTLSLILGILLFFVTSSFISSPAEQKLVERKNELKLKFELLNKDLDRTAFDLNELEKRDDNVFRMIFEAEPVPEDQRRAGFGGSDRYAKLRYFENSDLLINTSTKSDILTKRMLVQSESYKEVMNMVNNREAMASAIPAIQPIALDELTRFGSAFGRRFHPVFHVWKMHTGVDLTAPRGTPIHAAGDGVVFRTGRAGGYGFHVRINHGYGYVTLYGHLSKTLVRPGQKVKRGDIIGLVGMTGTATAPHLHYEVRVNGKFVNPVNFYYNDMTDEEYEQMLKSSATANTYLFE